MNQVDVPLLTSLGNFFKEFGPWAVVIFAGLVIAYLYKQIHEMIEKKDKMAEESNKAFLSLVEKQTTIMTDAAALMRETKDAMREVRDELHEIYRSRDISRSHEVAPRRVI